MSSKVFFGGFYLKRDEEILTSSLLNLRQPQKTFAGIQSLQCTGLFNEKNKTGNVLFIASASD